MALKRTSLGSKRKKKYRYIRYEIKIELEWTGRIQNGWNKEKMKIKYKSIE